MKLRGFTLVEILVTLSIVALISIMGVLTFQSFGRTSRIRGERDKMLNKVLDAKSFARSNRLENICITNNRVCGVTTCSDPANNCKYDPPKGGYGVHFNFSLKQYTIFADVNNDNSYDSEEELVNGKYSLPYNFAFKYPPQYMGISDGLWHTAPGTSELWAIFRSDGSTYIGSSGGSASDGVVRILEVGLYDSQNSIYSYLNINKPTGLIYADEVSPNPY